jgi:predicted GTPase
VVDPHRPGHELTYYPGETNVRLADIVIINKVDTASEANVAQVRRNVAAVNPDATIHEAASPVRVDDPELLRGRRVLAVEDGPTLTHGGMAFGAACIAAQAAGATLVDPRPYAVGEVAAALAAYPHVSEALPAMGYGEQQLRDLEATIARAAPDIDAVAIGTPIDLARLIRLDVPATRVRYTLALRDGAAMEKMLAPVLERAASAAV